MRVAGESARRRSNIRSGAIIMECLLVPCLQCVCYREALLYLYDLIVQSIQHALHCASRIQCANIPRDLKFENFKGAMDFVNRVADEAEAMDHHPDILIHGWNKVRLSVMTHSEGGLTEKDFKLAERINRLV